MNAQSLLVVVLGSSFLGGCLADKEPATPASVASSPSTDEGDGVTFVESTPASPDVSPANTLTNTMTSTPSAAAQSHNVYDGTGAPAGRGDPNGNFYDAAGAPSGRVDPNGSYYDRTGAPAGRIDSNGNFYDASGAPAGRVDGECDDACKRDLAKRILDARDAH